MKAWVLKNNGQIAEVEGKIHAEFSDVFIFSGFYDNGMVDDEKWAMKKGRDWEDDKDKAIAMFEKNRANKIKDLQWKIDHATSLLNDWKNLNCDIVPLKDDGADHSINCRCKICQDNEEQHL